MTVRRYSISILILLTLVPSAVFGASVTSEESATTDIDAWIAAQDEAVLEEGESLELLPLRIATEMDDLGEQIAELEALREERGWLSSIRAAWMQHTILVQIRRITLLLKAAEKQEAIDPAIMSQLDEYLLLVSEELRD